MKLPKAYKNYPIVSTSYVTTIDSTSEKMYINPVWFNNLTESVQIYLLNHEITIIKTHSIKLPNKLTKTDS